MYKLTNHVRSVGLILLLNTIFILPLAISQQFQPLFNVPVDVNNIADLKERSRSSKMATDLLMMVDAYKTMKTGQTIDDVMPMAKEFLVMKSDKVGLEIVSTDIDACETALRSMGATNIVHFKHVINCMMPMAKLEDMTGMNAAKSIKLVYKPITNIGAATSQGDIAQRSDVARALYNVNGFGSKIGVLSDSYDDLGGAANDIATGDLPGAGNPFGFTTPVDVLLDLGGGGIDEGRAMLQIVHDVAPGADLAFNSAFFGQAGFAQGIADLNTAGCDIIVDDIIYFAEPFYMPGIVAQAVEQVCTAGSMYFSSAGNADRNSYEGIYTAGPQLCPFYLGAHEFAPSDPFLQIDFPAGNYVVILQWDEPFYSVTGAANPASDVDLVLWDDNLNFIFGSFDFNNTGMGDAFEGIGGFFNGTFNFSIEHFSGPLPNRIKMIIYGPSPTWEYGGDAPTLTGHANTPGACAVGASSWYFTPAFGFGPPAGLNSFSSWGGVPIVFDDIGMPLAMPVTYNKPEFVAPDGGNTTFFVSDIPQDPDLLPNFFGTSASAPHAAAVASLIMEINPALTKAQIKTMMINTAQDMLTPGFDFGSGAGLIDAGASMSMALGANAAPNCRNVNIAVAPDGFAYLAMPDLLLNGAVGLGEM
ncbi:MAG: S8 family serine peptidase, partial [Saprospiraceae bacterium]|nr:S8 family serine peptidase [Saprospiraceae bacterium]